MKKFILYLLVFLMLAMSASAYNTVVSIGIIEMTCTACTSGAGLTGLQGSTGTVAVSTSAANCNSGTYVSGTSNSIGSRIEEGITYATGVGSLTSGTTYYGCLRLTEDTLTNVATPYLSTCANSGFASVKFTLLGSAACNALTTACIPNPTCGAADTLSFAFQFTA